MNMNAAQIRKVICLGALLGLVACANPDLRSIEQFEKAQEARMTPVEMAVKRRFHGIRGFGFTFDATEPTNAVVIFNERGQREAARATFGMAGHRTRQGMSSATGIPIFWRIQWREGEWSQRRSGEPRDLSKIEAEGDGTFSGGKIAGDYIVPIAERIPDALLEEMRKKGYGIRIKIRIHPQGVLLGWDLAGPPNSGPDGSNYSMAGGDFQEAYIYQGKALRMGWYIHPVTKERIETAY